MIVQRHLQYQMRATDEIFSECRRIITLGQYSQTPNQVLLSLTEVQEKIPT